MLTSRERSELDRHITGNYGEDQLKRSWEPSKTFWAGVKARQAGKPITSCRCKSEATLKQWEYGWRDEDMVQMAEHE